MNRLFAYIARYALEIVVVFFMAMSRIAQDGEVDVFIKLILAITIHELMTYFQKQIMGSSRE